ncbi:MAG: type II methionyl aminopeptidase [Thaumarchaeota archaeon]|nr:type II methionyl aminopeptidase [Candidatus Calditenuaceae archaeon]MDW8042501.1 type II methionyl aminopeptidase [Nitrososphaerota archaeon]
MSEGWYDQLRSAGEIARKVREEVRSMVKEGTSALEVAEWVESRIAELGGRPAFPCNVGVDSIAAHSTPTPSTDYQLRRGSLVKVDLGVSIEGYIADTAVTVPLPGSDEGMVLAAERALQVAVRVSRAGTPVSTIGGAIGDSITSLGYRPISNLSGHQIERYNLHAGLSIPNVKAGEGRLERGKVYAIEPFVTKSSAAGRVTDSNSVEIFRVPHTSLERASRLPKEQREHLTKLHEATGGLPYSTRWFRWLDPSLHDALYRRGYVHGYAVLVEKSGAPVAQAEHTVLIWEDGAEVLT